LIFEKITPGIGSEISLAQVIKEVIDLIRKPALKKLNSLHELLNVCFKLKGRELQIEKKLAGNN
jgi:hypothetical protein